MSLTCPACESVLSDDGKTLEQRSARLVELEKKAGRYDRELKELRREIAELKKPVKVEPYTKGAERKVFHDPKEKQPESKPVRAEPPAGLSPFQQRKWREEHGGR